MIFTEFYYTKSSADFTIKNISNAHQDVKNYFLKAWWNIKNKCLAADVAYVHFT